jgi:predicted TIM-barrel fold metal-dependent hydrolase
MIDWYLPREEFHRYLRPVVEAGFAKRIMFGSDEMIWPDAIKLAIDISADFLSPNRSATFCTTTRRDSCVLILPA